MRKKITYFSFALLVVSLLTACGKKDVIDLNTEQKQESQNEHIDSSDTDTADVDENNEIKIPSKEEVFAMRELVLEGMTDEEIERLTENVKVANLRVRRRITIGCNSKLISRLTPIRPRGLACNCTFLSA